MEGEGRDAPVGRWIIVLVAGALLGASMLAPMVWELIRLWFPSAGIPYARVFNRVAVLGAIILIIVLRRQLQLRRLGAVWRQESWREKASRAAMGVALAVFPALLVLPLVLQETALAWSGRSFGAASLVLALALPGALLVGAIEESFFRVSVFGNLARRWPVGVAAAISAVFYGAVHFLTPDREFVPASGAPIEGLRYLGRVLLGLGGSLTLLAVGGLTLIGLVLCVVLWRTGSLAVCVGMHAGWVAVTKVAIFVTTMEPGSPVRGSSGKRLLLLGSPWVWLAFVVSCILAIVLARQYSARTGSTRTGGA